MSLKKGGAAGFDGAVSACLLIEGEADSNVALR
jgi:hypothetical protein